MPAGVCKLNTRASSAVPPIRTNRSTCGKPRGREPSTTFSKAEPRGRGKGKTLPERNGPDLGGAGAGNLRGFLSGYTGGGSGERRVYPQPRPVVPVDSHEAERRPSDFPLPRQRRRLNRLHKPLIAALKARVSSGRSRCVRAVSRLSR